MKKFLSLVVLLAGINAWAQKPVPKDFIPAVDSLQALMKERTGVEVKFSLEKVMRIGKTLDFYFSRELGDYPWRTSDEKWFKSTFTSLSSNAMKGYKAGIIMTGRVPLGDLPMPEIKSDGKPVDTKYRTEPVTGIPLVRGRDSWTQGLYGRHIALWQSHGMYYNEKTGRWIFQRSATHSTAEDLYTQSYVLPFLIPMLENAGAVVLLPRERDWNIREVIVDNDLGGKGYHETGSWRAAPDTGFANPKPHYLFRENPFRMGSARMATTDRKGSKSISWIPDIPADGEYGVYVSYQTVPGSTDAAQYEVRHNGGVTRYSVNQQMGGSTWIYLGRFGFSKGSHDGQGVFLSNWGDGKSVVTADAVRFGGGMGNMAREPMETPEGAYDFEPEISGYPRFTEGSRYWLQWAGFNDTIYSRNAGATDYNDDYMSRGLWVNTLSDGSYLKPDKKGYNVPVDLSLAFHTDAGTTLNDSIIGTLAIYTRLSNDDEKYPNGEDRSIGRDYTDIVQTQIVGDIRALYEPLWNRRQLWDRSYAESRMPEVPGMLLELLSHQNLADMRYGLDPSFRFTVSRAIYKGMLKFLAYLNDFDYTVQPLPVQGFETHFNPEGGVSLSWTPVDDPLESTARATGYILYTRVDDGGFDNGRPCDEAHAELSLQPGHIYSFRVTATNAGGESFPSEILSVGLVSENAPTVLIVNNFDRVSAPVSFASTDSLYAGFLNRLDGGVPYLQDISFIGNQHEFRRVIPWMDDDSAGFGASDSDYETKVIAGNSFDYPFTHGIAWMRAGYNFVSASRSAVEQQRIAMNHYTTADLICGEQLTTQVGREGATPLRYQVFPEGLRRQIADFTRVGGNLLVSGAYVGSDLWEPVFSFPVDSTLKADYFDPARQFATEVLHYRWMTNSAAVTGRVRGEQNPCGFTRNSLYYFNQRLDEKLYCVESPDGVMPVGEGACTIFRYAENNISAGVAFQGDYKTVVLGFPVETLETQEEINCLIDEIARFFRK